MSQVSRLTVTARQVCRPFAWLPTPSKPARVIVSLLRVSKPSVVMRVVPAIPHRTPSSSHRVSAPRPARPAVNQHGRHPKVCPTTTSPWGRLPRTCARLKALHVKKWTNGVHVRSSAQLPIRKTVSLSAKFHRSHFRTALWSAKTTAHVTAPRWRASLA